MSPIYRDLVCDPKLCVKLFPSTRTKMKEDFQKKVTIGSLCFLFNLNQNKYFHVCFPSQTFLALQWFQIFMTFTTCDVNKYKKLGLKIQPLSFFIKSSKIYQTFFLLFSLILKFFVNKFLFFEFFVCFIFSSFLHLFFSFSLHFLCKTNIPEFVSGTFCLGMTLKNQQTCFFC